MLQTQLPCWKRVPSAESRGWRRRLRELVAALKRRDETSALPQPHLAAYIPAILIPRSGKTISAVVSVTKIQGFFAALKMTEPGLAQPPATAVTWQWK